MKISIFGAGYVGLVTGVCLAELGYDVLCVDVDTKKLTALKQGESPIYEPGLTEMLQRNIAAQRINFTDDIALAVQHGLLIFIAVGTPSAANGSADLRYVYEVAKNIGAHITDYRVVINKSTVPLGTAEEVKTIIAAELQHRQLSVDFAVVSNPEFLKEGAAIQDFMQPDRIIIGADEPRALALMRKLYLPFIDHGRRFLAMDIRSAELTKYAANAFLATKISFINEMSRLAEKVDADIEWVRQGIGLDPRIGEQFLFAGSGYGGSCFPKDVRALKQIADQAGTTSHILTAVEDVNLEQKQILAHKVARYFQDQLQHKTIALWGLAFKPNTDDMREASSRVLMEMLWQQGVKIQAYDPVAMPETQKIYGARHDLKLCQTAEQALEGADALVIVTEWQQFRQPDFAIIKQKLHSPVIFDGRNLFDPQQMAELGFTYYAMGRGRVA